MLAQVDGEEKRVFSPIGKAPPTATLWRDATFYASKASMAGVFPAEQKSILYNSKTMQNKELVELREARGVDPSKSGSIRKEIARTLRESKELNDLIKEAAGTDARLIDSLDAATDLLNTINEKGGDDTALYALSLEELTDLLLEIQDLYESLTEVNVALLDDIDAFDNFSSNLYTIISYTFA